MKRFASIALALLLLLLCFTAATAVAQQQAKVIVSTSANKPLNSLRNAAAAHRFQAALFGVDYSVPNKEIGENRTMIFLADLGQDPLIQAFEPTAPTTILTQFDGADNVDNGASVTPPDTDGDVSSDAVNRYVQMINIVTTVFDKQGNIAPGGSPFFSNAFWSGFGGLCETTNRGDPIVLYDETNDRWLVSQFAFSSTSSPPWLQCIAVSQTSDPLGAYNRYAYSFDTLGFPDYPKHGFTTDSITMIANLFNPGFAGTFIGAADKNCMYAGNATCTLLGANLGGGEFGFLAGDLDDPSGTAGFVPALFGTAMSANGLFDVWMIDPDFATPSNSTIARISRVSIASFDSDLCIATRERCVPHPGGGADLETLSGRLMHRLQIRDFGTHLSMVTAHTIDGDAAPFGTTGRAGIRWYELRSTDGGNSWSLHQEGTHHPADTLHRWMPSIAMNAAGDIGIGYMVSNATTPVEIRVSGQTAANSGSGTFDADEAECRGGVAGADWSGRAGDYSATNVDPDRDTFWHTNEFGRSTAFRGWGTAVCEFELVGGPVNQAPVVTITAPADGSSFNDGDLVTFTGTAIDNEDGDISANLSWSSDQDGPLGSGASVSTSSLSVGGHTINASVTDSGGAPGSDQIDITIVGTATDVHVESIFTEVINVGQGNKRGRAVVTIFDDLGNPVSGATVLGTFGGSFNESASGVTGANGSVELLTVGTQRGGVEATFCVDDVTASLPYDPSDNADAGFACGAGPMANDVHVESILLDTQNAGQGNKRGAATVVIMDDLGNPVAGATVMGTFSGDFNESASGVTDANGSVTLVTNGTARGGVSFSFCVDNVTASLPYDPSDNADPNFSCTP
ncbi:MAG TPA: Ig-like domain-containing protein [Acidobacteriota bacterium]|nr:Ig-like domain-containing protein [Acidobacteriota bacterium]